MSKYTRLATSITARYLQQAGAEDGYYLDGRMNRAGKYKDLDITLDRSDEGFYLAVFASADTGDDAGRAAQQKKRSMDRICELIKDESRGNIDAAINDMAENALHVAGRLSLGDEGQRLPYYAGILVRDSEMAAVTMGDGIAYLYRDDTLYPLTHDDFKLEAVDASGQAVENFDIFGAGKAGTIRYSNISQLQIDDCVILLTREVMEVIGQKGMLELLDEVYDQQEAAERVAEIMDEERPGKPFQFMMSFVEDVFTLSRRGRDRRDTTVHKVISEPLSETAMTDETTRFDPSQIKPSPYSAAAAGLVPEKEAEKTAETSESKKEEPAASESRQTSPYSRPEAEKTAEKAEDEAKEETRSSDETAEHPAAAAAVTAAARDTEEAAEAKAAPEEDVRTPAPAAAPQRVAADHAPEEVYEDHEAERKHGGRILFTILILILLALAFIGIWYMLKQRDDDSATQGTTPPAVESDITEETGEKTEPSEDKTTESAEATQTETSNEATEETTAEESEPAEETTTADDTGNTDFAGMYPETYEVVSGDTMIAIIQKVYSKYDLSALDMDLVNDLTERFLEENPDTMTGSVEDDSVVIYAETTLNVPDPEGLLEPAE